MDYLDRHLQEMTDCVADGPQFMEDLLIPPCWNSVNQTQSFTTCLDTVRRIEAKEAYDFDVLTGRNFKILTLSGSKGTCRNM